MVSLKVRVDDDWTENQNFSWVIKVKDRDSDFIMYNMQKCFAFTFLQVYNF